MRRLCGRGHGPEENNEYGQFRRSPGYIRKEVRARRGASVQGDCPAQQAQQLGKSGPDAETYAKAVVVADFEEVGDADVIRKVRQDFEAAGKAASDAELAGVLSGLMNEAIEQIKAG
jgi:hypothetical protein